MSASKPPIRTSTSGPDPSRSPLPLSAAQEGQVRELYYKRVRNKCADAVRDFAACAQAHTFTATFLCRSEQKRMNTCMMQFATQEEQDAARKEWFETIDKRREERERKEEKRKVDEKFWREWWDKEKAHAPEQMYDGQGERRPKK
ncbi:hypothetical protein EJ03DRAFT_278682 [Teratosphaeria nubilosa]|uniref:COX assembly mitochondrial protein n=1 Tax=Teratosphaeria nubilosa TaxID=161662 RepID=A0A6G1KZZ7_9PEZI|nr:hypothetical protein EJ03DRAFT_278682 [Teratosphaeria nubilosa]